MLNQRVMVYFNLHRGLWSIKSLKTGLVIGHSNTIILRDVEPKVSEAGRQRVIKEKKKNVHAGLIGTLKSVKELKHSLENFKEITYNPYKYTSFVFKDNDNEYFYNCQEAIMKNKRVYVTQA
jgi:hypothetical protein